MDYSSSYITYRHKISLLPAVLKNNPEINEDFLKKSKMIGSYLLGKRIGEGAFAKVRQGFHTVTGEKVAVKIIEKKDASPYVIKNLYREAKIMKMMNHTNIVELYEVLETKDNFYLVMEFCTGGGLVDYIYMMERLTENLARRLVKQLMSAVAEMHKKGIVHRDLKIENFLLTDGNDLKIIDFGLSNTTPVATYEKTGVYPQILETGCGSPAYAAPELIAGHNYGPQVDVWSIGVSLYVMLTGDLPFYTYPCSLRKLYDNMRKQKINPFPKDLSKDCQDLITKLLEPVPEWRISLKDALNHRWLNNNPRMSRSLSIVVPRSIFPRGINVKKQLCECPA